MRMKIQLRIGNYAVLKHRLHSPTKRSNCFNLTWNHSSRIDTIFFNSICFSFHSRVSLASHSSPNVCAEIIQSSAALAVQHVTLNLYEIKNNPLSAVEITSRHCSRMPWRKHELRSSVRAQNNLDLMMMMWSCEWDASTISICPLNCSQPLDSLIILFYRRSLCWDLMTSKFCVDWTNSHNDVLIVITSAYHRENLSIDS